ncbi:glucose-6-phosphate dehydrogenase [Nitrospira moscoviensis]|uniref:Glucose-6-phosphate 1-dehydrogenase n=1 Tax=Nitrospira moscoviensis TaxID=42253 RepID=A0A0K2GH66_NITMO|nr:glucose-6-phosphate dehydrogenase [Nitrospira moscoviensis]ALA60281.1 Glucose-6-phosphate 1-dehydrogenase [Nitrospira moscoviensis]
MLDTLLIFGASGDLTSRYLMPALARLHQAGQLPARFRIVGLARDAWDTDAFRRHLEQQMAQAPPAILASARAAVLAWTEYRQVDVTDRRQVAEALGGIANPLVAYLALPPALFKPAVEALAAGRLPKGSKLVLEKPFGTDLASAQELNRLLHDTFPEPDVFRLDHFLGKQTVQNILGFRFTNRIFEPLWNTQHIERVEIIWDETLTAAGRASFYDGTGALRDMIQNHLLQLLALIGMEPLQSLNERQLRDRKVDVLRAVRRLSPDEVARCTLRGRYGRGAIGEREILPYIKEGGVDPARRTETFAQVVLVIDNWRWAGVPFLLRTGKALNRDRRVIAIHFKPVPHLAFGQQSQPQPNVLTIELDPDRIGLAINVNAPGELFALDRVELESPCGSGGLPAYARLLLDVLQGDLTLSIRDDEAEESWRIVEPILESWAEDRVPLLEYPAGSAGPPEAEQTVLFGKAS